MKRIGNLTAILFIVILSFTACDLDIGVNGSGRIERDTLDLQAITGIVIEASFDVVLNYDTVQEVIVETDDNIMDLVDIQVINGLCYLDYKPGSTIMNSHTRVYISIPELSRLAINGSGDILGTNTFLDQDEISIFIGGSGDVSVAADANTIETEISGSGDVHLVGFADDHFIYIGGSGDVEAFDLITDNTTIKIYGSGNTECTVNGDLYITISGSGNVYYKGQPSISVNNYGSGNIYNYN